MGKTLVVRSETYRPAKEAGRTTKKGPQLGKRNGVQADSVTAFTDRESNASTVAFITACAG
jgi:hypothetical protein